MGKKVLHVLGQVFNVSFSLCPATSSISTLFLIFSYIFPPLILAFPWAIIFAAIGEHLLLSVFGLADSSVLYIVLMILVWAVGLIPLAIALRNRPRKVTWVIAGIGWVVVLGGAYLFTRMGW